MSTLCVSVDISFLSEKHISVCHSYRKLKKYVISRMRHNKVRVELLAAGLRCSVENLGSHRGHYFVYNSQGDLLNDKISLILRFVYE